MTDVAVVVDETSLVEALRARVDALNVSRAEIDRIAGLTPGYASKLLSVPPIKYFGPLTAAPAFWAMVGCLGLAVQLVEDPAATARFSTKLEGRNGKYVRQHAFVSSGRVPWLIKADNAREMAALRVAKVPAWKRRQIARKAGRASAKARRAKQGMAV